jgi:hypothetical protein
MLRCPRIGIAPQKPGIPRSKNKENSSILLANDHVVTVELADGQACFQMQGRDPMTPHDVHIEGRTIGIPK